MFSLDIELGCQEQILFLQKFNSKCFEKCFTVSWKKVFKLYNLQIQLKDEDYIHV